MGSSQKCLSELVKEGSKTIWVVGMPKVGKGYDITSQLKDLPEEEKIKHIEHINDEIFIKENFDKIKDKTLIIEVNPYEIYYMPNYPEHIRDLWIKTKENCIVIKYNENEANEIKNIISKKENFFEEVSLCPYKFKEKVVGEEIFESILKLIPRTHNNFRKEHKISDILGECSSYIPYISVKVAMKEFVDEVKDSSLLSIFKSGEFVKSLISYISSTPLEKISQGALVSSVGILSGFSVFSSVAFSLGIYTMFKKKKEGQKVIPVADMYKSIKELEKLSPFKRMEIEMENNIPPGTTDAIIRNFSKSSYDEFERKVKGIIEKEKDIEEELKKLEERVKSIEVRLKSIEENYLKYSENFDPNDIIEALRGNEEKIKEIEQRVEKLEKEVKEIKEKIDRIEEVNEEVIKNIKQRIKSEIEGFQINDFVWKNEDEKNLEEKLRKINPSESQDFLVITGNTGMGKTYLMKKLSILLNGIYIPIGVVGGYMGEKQVNILQRLISDEKEKKIVFFDDFQKATKEVKSWVEILPFCVIASREDPILKKRNSKLIKMEYMNENAVIEYLKHRNISIEKYLLGEIFNDISYPIKLHILTEYMKKHNIAAIDKNFVNKIKEEGLLNAGFEKWYETWVWKDLSDEEHEITRILSLLRESADFGMLCEICKMLNTKISETNLENLSGVIKKEYEKYFIFHDSFTEFVKKKLGDSRDYHKNIGMYYKGIIDTSTDENEKTNAKLFGMHHFRNAGDKENFASLFDLSFIQKLQLWGWWSDAREDLEFALICPRYKDEKSQNEIKFTLANTYYQTGKWDEAISHFKESMEIFKKLGDMQGYSNSLTNLGLVYLNQGKWDEATSHFKESMKIDKILGDMQGYSKSLGNLGSVYMDQGKWDEAISHFKESMEIKKKLGDVHGYSKSLMNLGLVYMYQGKWDEATSNFKESMEIKKKLGDMQGYSASLTNLGIIYANQEKWDDAISHFKESMEIFKKLGDMQGYSASLTNLGVVYKNQEKWAEAINIFKEAENNFKNLGDIHSLAIAYENLGIIYRKIGNINKAIACYENAKNLYFKLGLADRANKISNIISEIKTKNI